MASVNKVILIGNLGADPEIKYTQGNVPVANSRSPPPRSWKDKNSGEWKEKTEWHRVVAWRHLAERAERYLNKGKQVYVEGRLETRKWTGPGRQEPLHHRDHRRPAHDARPSRRGRRPGRRELR